MKRRDFLGTLAVAVLAVAPPVRAAVARAARAPRDLLTRIRKRTRPLTNNQLYEPHDLSG